MKTNVDVWILELCLFLFGQRAYSNAYTTCWFLDEILIKSVRSGTERPQRPLEVRRATARAGAPA